MTHNSRPVRPVNRTGIAALGQLPRLNEARAVITEARARLPGMSVSTFGKAGFYDAIVSS